MNFQNRGGVSAERRKTLEIEECGFLPKAATLLLQGLIQG